MNTCTGRVRLRISPNTQTEIGKSVKADTEAKDTHLVVSIIMIAITKTIPVSIGKSTTITPVIEATHFSTLKMIENWKSMTYKNSGRCNNGTKPAIESAPLLLFL